MTKIKAIIFDLDDTLYDVGPLTEVALRQSVKAMVENGLNCSFEQGLQKIKQIIKHNPSADKFEILVKEVGPDKEEIINAGKEVYYNIDFNTLELYPDARKTLAELRKKYKLILVTFGNKIQQNKKIDALAIRKYFSNVYIDDKNNKEEPFSEILKINGFKPDEIIVVGDRIDNEIKIANKLGMETIRVTKGKYKYLEPKDEDEQPDYQVNNVEEIIDIIEKTNGHGPKIVAIGGGTGLPTILEGLRTFTNNLTAIVTVTDSGRSSGMLRRELNVLPPGDIRNCLISLSNSEKLMNDLFQYRFEEGSLEGQNFGNLLIAVLSKITGSFERGLEEASRILKLEGKVLPSTFDNVHICAEFEDGNIICEENNIIDRNNPDVHLRSPIKKVFLKPSAKASKAAINEIRNADLIVLCPGSLFTSVITNLLVKGIPEAINKSKAKKVYVCNIMSQQSQTYGYKASDHVKQIMKYLDGKIDYVMLNTKEPSEELKKEYENENAHLIENDIYEINKLGVNIIQDEILEDVKEKKILWQKKNLLRHESHKIAKLLMALI